MRAKAWSVIVIGALLSGCQVHFVSDYDATTDKGVTELQRAIERYLGQIETLAAEPPDLESLVEACNPLRSKDTYRELQSELRTLILRNEARAKNERTIAQLTGLQDSLQALQAQQQERYAPTDPQRTITKPGDRCMSARQIEVNRQILEQYIRAILKLELAKRDFRKEE